MPAIPQTLPFARQKRGEELQRKAIMLLRDLSKAQDSTSKLLLARDLEKTKAALRSMGSGNTNAIIQ
ncbi:MAG: hypothetical protein OEQ74_05195, partial [Gammaproteobacteria bacterium]|nr:hypothetical protein [Gammaproteobacteria bacterium]